MAEKGFVDRDGGRGSGHSVFSQNLGRWALAGVAERYSWSGNEMTVFSCSFHRGPGDLALMADKVMHRLGEQLFVTSSAMTFDLGHVSERTDV